jgi:hypothetical protein
VVCNLFLRDTNISSFYNSHANLFSMKVVEKEIANSVFSAARIADAVPRARTFYGLFDGGW